MLRVPISILKEAWLGEMKSGGLSAYDAVVLAASAAGNSWQADELLEVELGEVVLLLKKEGYFPGWD